MVGLAGEGQNFDGNGMYVRFQPGGGDQTISSGNVGPYTNQTLYSNAVATPIGTRPAYGGKRPPYMPHAPCYKQALPDVNGAATGPPDGGTTPPPVDTSAPLLQPVNPFATGGR
jgi:hypothetical protein